MNPAIHILLSSALWGAGAYAQESPYASRALKVLAENRFESAPWMPVQAGKIKNGYGLEAYRLLAERFSHISEEVLSYCNEIDDPLSLAAFKALTERYAVIYAWQVRWAAEVNTPRELSAYRSVVSRKHTEKEEAEAALLDGLKSESHLLAERRWSLRRSRLFQSVLDRAIQGIPGSCRMRLSGAEVRVHDIPGLDVPEKAVARYRPPVTVPDDSEACGGSPGRLDVYMAPFLASHAEEDARSLGEILMKEVGCRTAVGRPARRVSSKGMLARADDLRDALAPAGCPRPSPKRSCAVRRYSKPRIVPMDVSESVRRVAHPTEVLIGDMNRVADPATPPAPDSPAPKAPGGA